MNRKALLRVLLVTACSTVIGTNAAAQTAPANQPATDVVIEGQTAPSVTQTVTPETNNSDTNANADPVVATAKSS